MFSIGENTHFRFSQWKIHDHQNLKLMLWYGQFVEDMASEFRNIILEIFLVWEQ